MQNYSFKKILDEDMSILMREDSIVYPNHSFFAHETS